MVEEIIDQAASAEGLRRLDLSHLGLREIPHSVLELDNLRALVLTGNFLTALPDWLGNLHRLQTLTLSNNEIRQLPESLGLLEELQYFDASNNRLSSLPETFRELRSLRSLNLSRNEFATLPDQLRALEALETLLFYSNMLTSLPSWIGGMSALHELRLGSNRLNTLPVELQTAVGLRVLDLSYNALTAVPDAVASLKGLEKLDLAGNSITELPPALNNFDKLNELYLHRNSGLDIPDEILGPTHVDVIRKRRRAYPAKPADILRYYFSSVGGSPLNEAKLILVGRGGVGKTSLVQRLVNDQFNAQSKTEGIQITEWAVDGPTDTVRLHIWDFGGQEIMHATHQFFLTRRSLYLLVLSGREGNEDGDADYWLRLIESFGGDSPVIVVLNKIAEHPFDLNRRALQQKYSGIREFIRTDCKDRLGIDDLRRAIEYETTRMEQVHARFPRRWFLIKDRLAGMQQNFLDFEQYRSICSELGERDRDAQERLAGYLHLLGIALNYREDTRLRDTHVLNPHWVTRAIYQIINSRELKEQKGVIRLRDLHVILQSDEYPNHMHPFLLDLMRKFELCFPFGDDENARYLIPELLDKQEPPLAAEFAPSECLSFEYHYPVLPEGLIPRFIVRSHAMSEDLPRWRSGVILHFEGNRALVKGDSQERTITIAVSGPTKTRRQLLAVIRADFERIHADINRLQPKAMVRVPTQPTVLIEYDKLLTFESHGVLRLQEVVNNRVVTLDVSALLDGVDVIPRSGREGPIARSASPICLFISYSHKDEHLRAELDAHLKLLSRIGLVEKWDDHMLRPGDEWSTSIDENIERADVILLLISADFINSDFCWHREMDHALARQTAGEAVVIPILVRDVDWSGAKFGRLQALPQNAKAVTLWADRDAAWKDVAQGIRSVVQRLKARRQT